MLLLARILVALGGLALLALIVWAGFVAQSNLIQEGAAILDLPWGIVTMADLYLGFLLIAVVIFITERNKLVALAWTITLPFLGNIVAAAWLVARAPMIVRRLSAGAQPPASQDPADRSSHG